jgi:hypothetical protein
VAERAAAVMVECGDLAKCAQKVSYYRLDELMHHNRAPWRHLVLPAPLYQIAAYHDKRMRRTTGQLASLQLRIAEVGYLLS